MQYRASFVMFSIGTFGVTFVEFVGILVRFERFGTLQGWHLLEVAFLYDLVNVAFTVADSGTRGFDHFGSMVKASDFDRLLLRPRPTALQFAGQELTLRRAGRLSQGVFILLWASAALDLDWTLPRVVLALGAIAGAPPYSPD
jgi:ABC-2 type transport system permease protein